MRSPKFATTKGPSPCFRCPSPLLGGGQAQGDPQGRLPSSAQSFAATKSQAGQEGCSCPVPGGTWQRGAGVLGAGRGWQPVGSGRK